MVLATPNPIWEQGDVKLYDQGDYLFISWPAAYSERFRNFLTLEEIGGIEAPDINTPGFHIPRDKYLTFQSFLPIALQTGQDTLVPYLPKGQDLPKDLDDFQDTIRYPNHTYEHMVTRTEVRLLFPLIGEEAPMSPLYYKDVEEVNWERVREKIRTSLEYRDILRRYLQKREVGTFTLQRGDIVDHQTREGLDGEVNPFIFDGTQLLYEDRRILSQGFYAITEFPPEYWKDVFPNIWLDFTKLNIKQIITQAEENPELLPIIIAGAEKYKGIKEMIHSGKSYYIVELEHQGRIYPIMDWGPKNLSLEEIRRDTVRPDNLWATNCYAPGQPVIRLMWEGEEEVFDEEED